MKTSKTFRLSDDAVRIIRELCELTGKSQAEVLEDALVKAFGDADQDQRDLMKVYEQSNETLIRLQYVRDSKDLEFTQEQETLHDFLDEVSDRCRSMPQFPKWAEG